MTNTVNQPWPLDLDAIEAMPRAEDIDTLLAEVRRLRARVVELERPAVEARRDEIRQSYTDLIAAAEEASDYEGAFVVQCRLREREEQWATEDASEAAGAPVAAEQPAGAPESHPDRHSASQAPLRAPDGGQQ